MKTKSKTVINKMRRFQTINVIRNLLNKIRRKKMKMEICVKSVLIEKFRLQLNHVFIAFVMTAYIIGLKIMIHVRSVDRKLRK